MPVALCRIHRSAASTVHKKTAVAAVPSCAVFNSATRDLDAVRGNYCMQPTRQDIKSAVAISCQYFPCATSLACNFTPILHVCDEFGRNIDVNPAALNSHSARWLVPSRWYLPSAIPVNTTMKRNLKRLMLHCAKLRRIQMDELR